MKSETYLLNKKIRKMTKKKKKKEREKQKFLVSSQCYD